MPKKPFDINLAIQRIRKAVEAFPKAAMFQLYEEGYRTTFEQLVACIISIRTYDEVTIPTAKRLFALARTPEQIARLTPQQIDTAIRTCTFHERKASQIQSIAQRTVADFKGELPCAADVLMSFSGVGVKCAHLVMGVACGEPFISVDVHVHRVSNRWGYISASTPEKSTLMLEAKLPKRYWIE